MKLCLQQFLSFKSNLATFLRDAARLHLYSSKDLSSNGEKVIPRILVSAYRLHIELQEPQLKQQFANGAGPKMIGEFVHFPREYMDSAVSVVARNDLISGAKSGATEVRE